MAPVQSWGRPRKSLRDYPKLTRSPATVIVHKLSLYTWTRLARHCWSLLSESWPLSTSIRTFPCCWFFLIDFFSWKRFLTVRCCPAMCVFVPLLAVMLHGPPSISPQHPSSCRKKKEKFFSPSLIYNPGHRLVVIEESAVGPVFRATAALLRAQISPCLTR